MRIRSISAMALVAALTLAACGGSTTPKPSGGSPAASGAAATGPATSPGASAKPGASAPAASVPPAAVVSAGCMADKVATKKPGKLTVSTDNPAFPPWFGGTVPDGSDWASYGGYPPSGEGFESAVAYAVAGALGFDDADVEWIGQANFGDAFKPGDKDFDFHVGQVSYRAKRAKAVDFSSGYYDVSQVIVALSTNAIAGVGDVAGLKGYTLGAPVGTTSLEAIDTVVKPDAAAKVFDDVDKGTKSLINGQIDGLVVDLPTGFYLRDGVKDDGSPIVPEGTIVGQLPQTSGDQEYFGLVMQKDSAFTKCANEALAAIKADGTWQAIFDEWLASPDSAPLLQ